LRQRHLALPSRLLAPGALYHGAFFGLPANVGGNIVHETEFYDFSLPESDPLPRKTEEICETYLSRIRALFVRSELSAAHFRRKYEPKWHPLLKVVPFHMPYLEKWESRIPNKPSISKSLCFIFVGNQARRKGLDYFVQFAREIRRRPKGSEARFIVVSNFQDGADFDLGGMEVHRGLNGAQVQDLMEQAHYLMLPTRADSHPKVCYEAAATGCGLILSDIRPLRDIWADGGHIFPIAHAIEAMATLAQTVLQDSKGASYGQKNRERFLKEFSPSASVSVHRAALGL
jgi:glycosyltransferase involved in cell wall biosynthesis